MGISIVKQLEDRRRRQRRRPEEFMRHAGYWRRRKIDVLWAV